MTHIHCDRCGRQLEQHDTRYKVTFWPTSRPNWSKDNESDLCPDCIVELRKVLARLP